MKVSEADYQAKMNAHQAKCKTCRDGKGACGTLTRIGRTMLFGGKSK